MRNGFVPLTLFLALAGAASVSAQPLPPPRVLTPPKPPAVPVMPPANAAPLLPMPPVGRPLPPPGYRPSAYQVWQGYGLTYQGWLRPRVIQVQGGGYYLSNGYLFPYVNVFPGHHFMPMAKE